MEEEFFGDPPSLLRLANTLEQTSQGLWQLQDTLNGQVTGLVPSGWDGPAASAFQARWNARRSDIRQAAELARLMNRAIARLGADLQEAKALFLKGKVLALSNGLVVQYLGSGFTVVCYNEPPTPQQAAALPVAQADVQKAWAIAEKAWLQARGELGVDAMQSIGWLRNFLRIPINVAGDTGDLLVGVGDFLNRVDLGDYRGAWGDVKKAALTIWSGIEALGEMAGTVLKRAGELNPEAYGDDLAAYEKRSAEIGKAINDKLKAVWDRPGDTVTGVGTFAVELVAPGKIMKALGGDVAAAEIAALQQREAAAARAVDAVVGRDITKYVGAANEGANLELLAQRGETAANLNDLRINFPTWDVISDKTVYSAKAYGVERPGGRLTPEDLGRYDRQFADLVDPVNDSDGKAARTMLKPQYAEQVQQFQAQGAWPKDLPTNATEEQLAQFGREKGVMIVPDDHVDQVRDFVRNQSTPLPDRYGLPDHPTDAQVQGLLDRIQPSGISSDAINRIATNRFETFTPPVASTP